MILSVSLDWSRICYKSTRNPQNIAGTTRPGRHNRCRRNSQGRQKALFFSIARVIMTQSTPDIAICESIYNARTTAFILKLRMKTAIRSATIGMSSASRKTMKRKKEKRWDAFEFKCKRNLADCKGNRHKERRSGHVKRIKTNNEENRIAAFELKGKSKLAG